MRTKYFTFYLLASLFYCQLFATEPQDGNPLRFTENSGQFLNTDGQVADNLRFKGQVPGGDLYLTDKGMSLVFVSETDPPDEFSTPVGEEMEKDKAANSEMRLYRVDLNLVGINTQAQSEARKPETYHDNYYFPHCPDGILGVKSFQEVIYKDVYPGIDWEILAGDDGSFKTQFIVHPGADPSQIRLKVEGASQVLLNAKGELLVKTPDGDLLDGAPEAFQGTAMVDVTYRIADDEVHFDLANHDPSKTLVIDPYTRVYATFLGGNSSEWYLGHVTDTDLLGFIYMAGHSPATNFPTSVGAYQTSMAGARDCYVAKFDTGGVRLFTTFIGGSGTEGGIAFKTGLCTDPFNNIWMASVTQSSNFPVTGGAQQASWGGSYDAVLTKFSNNGALLYSTFFGGSNSESNNMSRWGANSAPAIASDVSGNIFMMGMTNSSNFPVTAGAFQSTLSGGYDAYFAKWGNAGNLMYATYYGGTSNEETAACGIAVDQFGNAWMTGCTGSINFPVTASAHQGSFGGTWDQYLVKWSNTGTRLYSTYYGGTGDEGVLCDVDVAFGGDVWISVFTQSINFPVTSNAYQGSSAGGWEVGMVRFNNAGVREYASYYGSTFQEEPWDIAQDRVTGNIAISGCSWGTSWPTTGGPFQVSSGGSQDGTIVIMDSTGVPVYSTYYGSTGHDEAFSGVFDRYGNFWASGHAASTTFPVTGNAFQPSSGGSTDAFLVKFVPPTILGQQALSLKVRERDEAKKMVRLVWDYQGEPVHNFSIERNSLNGWVSIAEVSGNTREYMDHEALEGMNHYRLRVSGQEGAVSLSHQVSAWIPLSADKIVGTYPNPLNSGEEATVMLQLLEAGTVRTEVLDMQGKMIYQARSEQPSGISKLEIPMDSWAQGTYLIRIQTMNGPLSTRIHLQ